jgi:hypothetical protein
VIELKMVSSMAKKAALIAPLLLGALWLWGGPRYALSGAVGLAMALANLWLVARILGVVAENAPQLLLIAALVSFAFGLLGLTGIALALEAADLVFFPVTGFTLVGAHLGLVLWEAPGAYGAVGRARS